MRQVIWNPLPRSFDRGSQCAGKTFTTSNVSGDRSKRMSKGSAERIEWQDDLELESLVRVASKVGLSGGESL